MAEIDRLAARIMSLEDQVRQLSAPQLAKSSIMDGAVEQVRVVETGEIDEYGAPVYREEVVARYGAQPDGTNTVVILAGPTPPPPMEPDVVGGPGSLVVTWNGLFNDGSEPPSDFAYVAVHVADAQAVDEGDVVMPSPDTVVNTIHTLAGASVVVGDIAEGSYYVSLVTVSDSGAQSEPAPYSTGEPGTMTAVDVTAREAAAAAQRSADEAAARAAAAVEAAATARAEAAAANNVAIQAQHDATTALERPDGSKVWYSVDEPSVAQGNNGDTWYKREATAFGDILGMWEKRDDVWEVRSISSSVIASLEAGKITTGTLGVGQVITVGDRASGTYVELGNSSLQVFRPDGDGGAAPTVSVGGATADTLMITDPTDGTALAGFNGDGDGWAAGFSADTLTVAGYPLGDMDNPDDLLSTFSRARVAGFRLAGVVNAIQANAELGIAEIGFTLKPYRIYRVSTDTNIGNTANGSTWRLFMRYTSGDPAPAPLVASAQQLCMGFYSNGAAYSTQRCHLDGWMHSGGTETECRVLLSLQRIAGGYPSLYQDGTFYFTVEDMGPWTPGASGEIWADGRLTNGGGTPYATPTGSTNTAPVTQTAKTYTQTWPATWSRTWRGSSVAATNEMRTGFAAGNKMTGAYAVSGAMYDTIKGSKVTKVEAFICAYHWYYNSGGILWYGPHGALNAPASFPGQFDNASFTWNSKTGGRWITLPAAWYPKFADGTYRGISVGGYVSSNNDTYYSKLRGAGTGSSVEPKIRVTFTK